MKTLQKHVTFTSKNKTTKNINMIFSTLECFSGQGKESSSHVYLTDEGDDQLAVL